jgi:hypothetical protein
MALAPEFLGASLRSGEWHDMEPHLHSRRRTTRATYQGVLSVRPSSQAFRAATRSERDQKA